jgi:hypothetical protein
MQVSEGQSRSQPQLPVVVWYTGWYPPLHLIRGQDSANGHVATQVQVSRSIVLPAPQNTSGQMAGGSDVSLFETLPIREGGISVGTGMIPIPNLQVHFPVLLS